MKAWNAPLPGRRGGGRWASAHPRPGQDRAADAPSGGDGGGADGGGWYGRPSAWNRRPMAVGVGVAGNVAAAATAAVAPPPSPTRGGAVRRW